MLPTLQAFVDIKNIPKIYGGELDFDWGQRPNLDPAIRAAVTWEGQHTDFPPGPVYWRPIDHGLMECVAVGSVNQVERMERVCTIPISYSGPVAEGQKLEPMVNGQPLEVVNTEAVSGENAEAKTADTNPVGADPPSAVGERPEVTTGIETKPIEPVTEAEPLAASQVAAESDKAEEVHASPVLDAQGLEDLSLSDHDEKRENAAGVVAEAEAPHTTAVA